MDENVLREVLKKSCTVSLLESFWMGTIIWHFRQRFGSKLQYVWQWAEKNSWQRWKYPVNPTL